MAGKELNMKEIREILRLKSLGFGKRKISKILGIHRNTISKYFDTKDNPKIENKFPEKNNKVFQGRDATKDQKVRLPDLADGLTRSKRYSGSQGKH